MGRNRTTEGIKPLRSLPQQQQNAANIDPHTKPPYYYCSISLQSTLVWTSESAQQSQALCDAQGNIYWAPVLIAFLRNFKRNPLTGHSQTLTQAIPVKFHLEVQGLSVSGPQITCPISGRNLMGDKVKVALIRTTGNVYAYDTIRQMNLETNNYRDLLDGTEFDPESDIIVLQDPVRDLNSQQRHDEYWYVRNKIAWVELLGELPHDANSQKDTQTQLKEAHEKSELKIHDPAAERILKEMERLEREDEERLTKSQAPTAPAKMLFEDEEMTASKKKATTAAASLTSTAVDVRVKDAEQVLSEKEQQYERLRDKHEKGYVRINTSLGALDFELYTHVAPKACENFIAHAKAGYYNSVVWHRVIKGFMCQSGDPTGTGRGGQSIWGKPFEDEFDDSLSFDSRGLLACANKGIHTNGSQFFITFAPTPHLNHKHTIFGKLIGGDDILSNLEKVPTGAKDRPVDPIPRIESMIVTVDPFERDTKRQEHKKRKEAVRDATREENSKIGQWYSAPQPKLAVVREGAKVGKYLPPVNSALNGRDRTIEAGDKQGRKRSLPTDLTNASRQPSKRARKGQFDFSRW